VNSITINPVGRMSGHATVPGDKSISHRALMLAAIATGESRINNLATGADVRSTRTCLRQLGVDFTLHEQETRVRGHGLESLQTAHGPLDAGNSGTTMRLLSGILATRPFTSTVTGDESLNRRPMRRIIEPLQRMGASIAATPGQTAPLTISGGSLRGIEYELPVASAQVKSCILFAGLDAEGETIVIEPAPSRDHSERLLEALGAQIVHADKRILVRNSRLHEMEMNVPGDFSSAAFLLAAATLLPGSELVLANVGLNPTRTAFMQVLLEMGGRLEFPDWHVQAIEPYGDILARHNQLRGLELDPAFVPQLIDEIPILAILATQAEGETVITGASELRVKESDRLAALATNLRAMGATFEELPDGLMIQGPVRLRGATVDSFGDHRIAMACAIAGLCADSPTTIRDAGCADISFPGFFEMLRALCR
jgi:3-phosphoshikimate 1-carboxyvinyltransferase